MPRRQFTIHRLPPPPFTDLKAGNARLSRLIAAQYSWTGVFTRLFTIYREVLRDFPGAR